MQKHATAIVLILTIFFTSACQATSEALPTPTAIFTPPVVGGYNLGRTYTKLINKEPVKLGFLGGSITENPGYLEKVTRWFEMTYPGVNFTSINAGVGGTGSEYGAFRVSYDLQGCDLVFIEFAVNDHTTDTSDRGKVMKYTEGIVRRLYKTNPKIEIVFIDLASKRTAESYQNGGVPLAVHWHQEIASHYTIPGKNSILYINPGEEMVKLINSGKATWSKGTNSMTEDDTHPNDRGYEFISQKIIEQLKISLTSSSTLPPFYDLPESISVEPVETGNFTPVDEKAGKSGWEYQTPSDYPFLYSAHMNRWIPAQMNALQEGASLQYEFKDSKYIGVDFVQHDEGGSFDAWIDDGPVSNYDLTGYSMRRNKILFSESLTPGYHTLHIRVTGLPVVITGFLTNPEAKYPWLIQ
jgi:lysophospholipase L1-like esterase